MIKNDRQYQVCKTQVGIFKDALDKIPDIEGKEKVLPSLKEAQKQALESQRDEMKADIKEYELLRNGKVKRFAVEHLDELPNTLIRARVAAGLNLKDLAAMLSLEERDVQEWEANDYIGLSIPTLKALVKILNISVNDKLFVVDSGLTAKKFLRSLSESGIQTKFILRRLLPANISSALKGEGMLNVAGTDILRAASTLSRIFGMTTEALVKCPAPSLSFQALAAARFKLPANVKPSTVNAYTIYAHYLAGLVESCSSLDCTRNIPEDWHVVHKRLTQSNVPITFEKTLKYLWDCGIIIIPLSDEGGFHGAVWKIRNHYVIVLKQNTLLESRWLFDLLHEVGHIVSGHISKDMSLIEEQPISPDVKNKQEVSASEWAEDVILDGKSDEIERACVKGCGGRLQRLKIVVPSIATSYNVNAGALANHMAFRLAMEGKDWWGAAHNLQAESEDPFAVAREELLKRVDMQRLNWADKDILMRALMEV